MINPASSEGPRAFSYMRFSTLEQGKGDSLNRQTMMAREWADKHGVPLDAELNLTDKGVSAYRGANAETGALGAFLDTVKAGAIPRGSWLLVESLDRISRQVVRKAARTIAATGKRSPRQRCLPSEDCGWPLSSLEPPWSSLATPQYLSPCVPCPLECRCPCGAIGPTVLVSSPFLSLPSRSRACPCIGQPLEFHPSGASEAQASLARVALPSYAAPASAPG
jgi:hypothetical protein